MRVAIAEYGLEGQASYRYYSAKGHDVTIVTNRVSSDYPIPEGAQSIVRANVFDDVLDFDLVLRSPPRPPASLKTTGKIWSATNEFFSECPAPIIGVTGTKGKGTTSSLIASIIQAAGQTVHLVGNIGTASLEILPQVKPSDVVVFELSSFQLWDLEKSPHVAVVLPIEADHLDVHNGMEDYVAAKSQIARHQVASDVIIYHKDDQNAQLIADLSLAQNKIAYPQSMCSEYFDALKLPGAHNRENATAAIIAASNAMPVSAEAIIQGLGAFSGLPHRLKFVSEKGSVKYYDDSIATTPGSAIAAINSFDEPKVLILGGLDKGADYRELISLCAEHNVKVVAMGANRQKIQTLCGSIGVECYDQPGDMQSAVTTAHSVASEGSVVILSPAAASFDMFKNYADRGDQFINAVESLS